MTKIKKFNEHISENENWKYLSDNPLYKQFIFPYEGDSETIHQIHYTEQEESKKRFYKGLDKLESTYKKKFLYMIIDILDTLVEHNIEVSPSENMKITVYHRIDNEYNHKYNNDVELDGFSRQQESYVAHFTVSNFDHEEQYKLDQISTGALSYMLRGLLGKDKYMKIYFEKYGLKALKQINKL